MKFYLPKHYGLIKENVTAIGTLCVLINGKDSLHFLNDHFNSVGHAMQF